MIARIGFLDLTHQLLDIAVLDIGLVQRIIGIRRGTQRRIKNLLFDLHVDAQRLADGLRGLLYAFVVFALFLFLELIEKLLDLRMIRFQQIECGLTPCAARCA